MPESLLDPSWYRVAGLKPRLRPHVRLHRHQYRGQAWYVLQDAATGRFHRFTPAAYQVIGLLDGQRTLQQIWDTTCARLGDDAPTQGETIRLLHQLHAADVLQSDILPDTEDLQRRHDRQRRSRWLQQLKSPLAVRIPLFDPNRFLDATLPFVRPLFGWLGAVLWLGVVTLGVLLAAIHWEGLTANVAERVLALQNLFLLVLVYPAIKAVHEFGHAYMVKAFGGEVHQMGIMLLVFVPVPYVDASAATAYPEKWRRALVGAAGMLVELFLAALALMVWVAAEPGIVRTLAFNVALVGSVSTVLFNGNPLLRFDGYYILSDLIEIPNLAQRANRYLAYLLLRFGFGNRQAESPATAPGERGWFVGYAVASFVYRLFLYLGIALFIASEYYVVGVLIAIWSLTSLLVWPVLRGLKHLVYGPELRRQRRRAVWVTAGGIGGLGAFLFLLPLPLATIADGVVWVPEQAIVRAGAAGFVGRVAIEPGAPVHAGDVVIVLEDPLLPAEVRVLEGQLAALDARYRFFFQEDRVQAQITREEMDGVEARLARKREALAELQVRAPVDGTLVVPDNRDLPGRFIPQGGLLGYVLTADPVTVRVAVPQADADLVRHRTRRVDARRVEDLATRLPAAMRREVPAASQALPSAALGTAGGGPIAIDPRDDSGRTAFQNVFLFDVALPPSVGIERIGSRIHVRFDHGTEPLAFRWYRGLRQLFLSRLDV